MFLGRSNPTEGLLHSSWTGRANLNKCLVQPCWGTCMGNQVRTRCRWPPMLASTRRKKKQKTAQRISLSLDNRGPHKCSAIVLLRHRISGSGPSLPRQLCRAESPRPMLASDRSVVVGTSPMRSASQTPSRPSSSSKGATASGS
jgi:hypothetical protein